MTGHHRKHGIRLLGQSGNDREQPPVKQGRRIYDEAVRQALIVVWEAADRLTGALLDRLTHYVHILEMNGESYRLKGSRQSVAAPSPIAGPDQRRLAPRRCQRQLHRQGEGPHPAGQVRAVRHHPGGTVLLRP